MKKFIVATIISIFIVFGVFEIITMPKEDSELISEDNVAKIDEPIIPDDITIHMTVGGDVLCHNTNFWDAYDASTGTYDFSYSFEDIKKYFDRSEERRVGKECM